MAAEIIIVSGLPRSGTSLMMQMLDRGSIEIVTDNVRTADTDNPKGYCEFEQVKAIERDASWIPATRGKAFKMVSQLLYHLPREETYRIIFMERDLDEVLLSQEKMLERLGRVPAPREKIQKAFRIHLERLHEWLSRQPNIAVLRVNYKDLIARPREFGDLVQRFLGRKGDVEAMATAVDPSLYRNKKAAGVPVTGRTFLS
jgi:hypothetical protein